VAIWGVPTTAGIGLWRRFRDVPGPAWLDGITLFSLAAVTITRYRYRGISIPGPWPDALAGPTPTA
jgi:hypothetical protein